MSIKIITGNIFTSSAQTLVNTVNCEGVMGAGIALECRLRYPTMFERYQELCLNKQLKPGKLWIYREEQRWILNFPTKNSWKHPSRLDYLEQGLDKLMSTWQSQKIESIAFPMLGADRGGLNPDIVMALMTDKLAAMAQQIPVEIYQYDPKASDDLYQKFAKTMLSADLTHLQKELGISLDKLMSLEAAIRAGKIYQLNQLAGVPRVGEKTLEKLFAYCQSPNACFTSTEQQSFGW